MPDPESPRPSLTSRVHILADLVLVIALMGFAGWILDVPFLKRVLPQGATMKFNTAIGLFLAGIALRGVTRRNKRSALIGRVCAAAVVCLGAFTLFEYLVGLDSRFDCLVFWDSSEAGLSSYPGRMAPHSAACFCLFGLAFLCSSRHGTWLHILSKTLLSLAALIALGALAGHLYGALYFYGISKLTGMAVHTVVAFLLLCAGLFLAQSEDSPQTLLFSRTSGGVTARRLLPAAVLVPLLLGWLKMRGQKTGLYDAAAGEASLITTIILVFVVLIALTSRVLHRLDLSRQGAEKARDRAIVELQKALDEVRTLRGLVPMCAWCSKIREGDGQWSDIASYISTHTEADVSHGICPECAKAHFPEPVDA